MSREAAIAALVSLVSGAYAWASPVARRLKTWDAVDPGQRPAAFVYEGGRDSYTWTQSPNPVRSINVQIVAYTNAGEGVVGAIELNEIMDALDAALKADPVFGKQNLGGAVSWARIDGEPFKDPGDIDGTGMLVVPVKMLLP